MQYFGWQTTLSKLLYKNDLFSTISSYHSQVISSQFQMNKKKEKENERLKLLILIFFDDSTSLITL